MRVAAAALFLLAAGGGGGLAWYTAQAGKAQPAARIVEVRHLQRLATSDLAQPQLGEAEPAATTAITAGKVAIVAKSAPVAEPNTLPAKAPATPPKAAPDAVRISAGPLTSAAIAELVPATAAAVEAAYTNGQAPVFVADGALTPAGEVAVRWLSEARFHHLTAIAAAYKAGVLDAQPIAPAQLEAALASQLAQMAASLVPNPRDAAVMENPKTGAYVSPDTLWQGKPAVAPTTPQVAALLAAAGDPQATTLDDFLHKLEPQHPQYRRLVTTAKRFHDEICSKGEWGTVYVPKKSAGRKWANVEALTGIQRRLAAENYYSGPLDGVFNEALEASLKEYQSRQNLKPVGRYNTPTAKSLNMPCKRRVDDLALNANRWRFTALLPSLKTYVHVNIPGFLLNYFRDGKLQAEQRVIVGKGHSWYSKKKRRRIYRNATPVLSDVIHSVIFNPSWTLPRRVIINEMNPKIEAEPNYLKEHGYVRRKRADGAESIVQLPSNKNALGDVKFYFPNAESIYLHDTPRRGLFMRSRRDFSHGCIRVHKAVEFATVVVRDDLEARGKKYTGGLKTLAARNNTVRFKLHDPIPVFLEYYTATVNAEGVPHFHPDVYDYDYAALVKPIGKMKPPTVW